MGSQGVSVIMPVLNEELHLAEAVAHILDQDYDGPIEVVLALGPSRDRTNDVAAELATIDSRVRTVDSPTGRTAAGLNAAIALTQYDVIVRVDGHALIPRDYVRTGVATLEATGADNVGGIMAAEGVTNFEKSVAAAMTSWFGVGGAAFHIGGEAGPALTVYLGCFRKSAIERVGGFDESMVRAQDWEMNHRIRSTGGEIWFTPDMKVTYRPRASVRALAKQYHEYGRWRREIARRDPSTVSLRYLAPPITLVGVSVGTLIGLVGLIVGQPAVIVLGFSAPAVYVVASLVATARATRIEPFPVWRRLPMVFATMHASWGAGFLRGPG
ncbi:MAG: glycosyltransferase family 2 protein [Actinobacteria bacterium]|jgi:glycosyltransferase involved in cell wall biosynthesis|nr:glycosyltransferase family 2 protein [Actinomycetota bacterium]